LDFTVERKYKEITIFNQNYGEPIYNFGGYIDIIMSVLKISRKNGKVLLIPWNKIEMVKDYEEEIIIYANFTTTLI
jgi:hypothetical protein